MTGLRRAAIVVAILVLTAGCLGSFGVSDNGDNSSDVEGDGVDDVEDSETISESTLLDGIDDVESYQFELEQTMDMAGESMEMTAEGAIDEPNEEMRMDVDMGMPGMEMESYIVDETMYMQMMGEWMQSDVSDEEVWAESETLDGQAEIIDDSELEEVGTETIDGAETTVLELDLGEEAIAALEADEAVGMPETDSIEYRLYVDESTGYLHKIETEMTVESMGDTVETEMKMVISDHNEPVDITLPDEAEDAPEVDDLDDPYGGEVDY